MESIIPYTRHAIRNRDTRKRSATGERIIPYSRHVNALMFGRDDDLRQRPRIARNGIGPIL